MLPSRQGSLLLLTLGVASLSQASGDSILSWLSALAPEKHEGGIAAETHVFQEWDADDEEDKMVISDLVEADVPTAEEIEAAKLRARAQQRKRRAQAPNAPNSSIKSPNAPNAPSRKKKAPNAKRGKAPIAPGAKKKKAPNAPSRKAPAPSGKGGRRRERH